ncbi:unnamed protein product [Cylicocyclus nassatus]|uniref:Glycosyltransferase family 92 protein n=1 Tax=Cylicocyclus nassatus TaxID=53992 RepID=A0AA36H0G0_CYLNA|nr:unnamed protein product [Cylicocyclus nassatus]
MHLLHIIFSPLRSQTENLGGLDHFYLYVKKIDDYSYKLLKSYEADGVAEVIHLKGIIEGDKQYAEVQDCLQRNRYRSRYVIFADLDERILPTGNISLASFVRKKMKNNPDVGSLWLGARWVLRTTRVPQIYEGDATLLNHLPTLIFHNTSSISPHPASPKCIVDPTKVFWLWVHRVKYFFPEYRNLYVHESVVYIRHYRDVAAGDWGRKWKPYVDEMCEWSLTPYPPHLMKALYDRVKKRLDQVYIKNRQK